VENNKTPGSNGLPKEFYLKFFQLFSVGFVSMITDSFTSGILPQSQRLLAKILSQRLSSVLPLCIHPDQTCAIPGRSINYSISNDRLKYLAELACQINWAVVLNLTFTSFFIYWRDVRCLPIIWYNSGIKTTYICSATSRITLMTLIRRPP